MPDPPVCVYCRRRPSAEQWKPFCSERCKMADLGRWLAGNYRIGTSEDQVIGTSDDPELGTALDETADRED